MAPRRKVPVGNPKIAVEYVRVSTDRQELSQEAQQAANREWARRNGVTIAKAFRDEDVCGESGIEKCPGLMDALRALETSGAGVLLVAKRDRLGRDVIKIAMVERLAERSGARLRSSAGEGDGDTPQDKLLRTMIDAFAAYELSMIRMRVRSGLQVKIARGELVGSLRYGYSEALGADGETKILVINPEEQAVLGVIRELRAAGMTWRGIVGELERRGISPRPDAGRKLKTPRKGPKRWDPSLIRRLWLKSVPK